MTDKLTSEQRSYLMSRVKGKNTKPEKLVRSLLHGMGYRFRLYCKDLPGSPDIVLPRHKKVILVHGCFWHGHPGCKKAARPKSNQTYWNTKLDENIARDTRVRSDLRSLGWQVLVTWQCEIDDRELLLKHLRAFMAKPACSNVR